MKQVLKRDGITVVDFNCEKIETAIEKAMIACKEYDKDVAREIAIDVTNILNEIHADDDYVTVEEIQEIVETQMIESGLVSADVIKEYIRFRYARTLNRIAETNLAAEAEKVIKIEDPNINHENANLNGSCHSGKLSKMLSTYSKWYTNLKLLSKDVREAYEKNRIHIHDLDWYANGAHNCTFIDMGRLLKRGFSTGNGSIRTANSLRTAFNLIPIIFQSQQNSQYGGVATNKLDYDLEPYVDISFTKLVKATLKDFIISLENLNIESSDLAKYRKLNDEILNGRTFSITDEKFKKEYPSLYTTAYDKLLYEAKDSAQAFIHNLNTMCSRVGSQVPFTSINYGTCTSEQGRLIIKSVLEATIDGLGNHETPIFP